jgi:hypothetical protein
VLFAKIFSAFIIANYSLNRSYSQLKLGLGIIILPRLGQGNVRLLIWKYLINPYKTWTLLKGNTLRVIFQLIHKLKNKTIKIRPSEK